MTCRNVFRLLYCGEGLTIKQVAIELGLSEQRVRQALCELRERLRRLT
ncbi:MAG TPA: sigma factor-like helix-turn-helix DNA-binding protein [Polyangiaceae bacterium]|nr:sigma factor-like helix-turn-helix DNA-binding protein [Polyangiaceae bacterium]